jgi:hypothetical protein
LNRIKHYALGMREGEEIPVVENILQNNSFPLNTMNLITM